MPTKKTQHSEPLAVVLTAQQRRRFDAVMRKHGLDSRTFPTCWVLAAVQSLERTRRPARGRHV